MHVIIDVSPFFGEKRADINNPQKRTDINNPPTPIILPAGPSDWSNRPDRPRRLVLTGLRLGRQGRELVPLGGQLLQQPVHAPAGWVPAPTRRPRPWPTGSSATSTTTSAWRPRRRWRPWAGTPPGSKGSRCGFALGVRAPGSLVRWRHPPGWRPCPPAASWPTGGGGEG